jgi:hypothetical protein
MESCFSPVVAELPYFHKKTVELLNLLQQFENLPDHIENIKTVATLTNKKEVFMCILRFHARPSHLRTYETLLIEITAHPGSEQVPEDQSVLECAALADRVGL